MRVPAESCHWCIFQFSKTCQERALGVEKKTERVLKGWTKNTVTTSNPKRRIRVTWNLMKSWTYQALVSSVSTYGNTLGCFGTSRCPFIPLPKIGAGTWRNLQPPNKIPDGDQQKIFMFGMGKSNSRTMNLKCSCSNFRDAFEHVISPPCVNNLPCTGGLKFWTCAIYQSVGLSQPRIIQQKNPEKKTRNFLPRQNR